MLLIMVVISLEFKVFFWIFLLLHNIKKIFVSGGTHLFGGANGLRRRGRQTYTR